MQTYLQIEVWTISGIINLRRNRPRPFHVLVKCLGIEYQHVWTFRQIAEIVRSQTAGVRIHDRVPWIRSKPAELLLSRRLTGQPSAIIWARRLPFVSRPLRRIASRPGPRKIKRRWLGASKWPCFVLTPAVVSHNEEPHRFFPIHAIAYVPNVTIHPAQHHFVIIYACARAEATFAGLGQSRFFHSMAPGSDQQMCPLLPLTTAARQKTEKVRRRSFRPIILVVPA